MPQKHTLGSTLRSLRKPVNSGACYVNQKHRDKLWLSVLLKDTSAVTSHAGIRTHILWLYGR